MVPAATLPRRVEVAGDLLRKFVRRGARENLSKLLGKLAPADVALLLRGLTPPERVEVFHTLLSDHPEAAGAVLGELEPEQRLALVEKLAPEEIARVLEELATDDAVFLVDSLPAALHDEVVALVDLGVRDLADVQTQLTYADDSAGRIMDSELFALPQATTVGEAIAAIQSHAPQIDMIFYLYVVDEDDHLVGVTSLRQLLLSPPARTLAEIMRRAVIKVTTDTDQEEVAQLAARYDLLAIPVTDADNRLLGIVTVDDIIDVVREEATEDLLKVAGTRDDELLYQDRALRVAWIRLPVILVNLAGLVLTGWLLRHFQVSLGEALFLLTFVPVVMGMGGNVGSQASILAVRGLATGRLASPGGARRLFWQQVRVAAILAAVCGLLVAAAATLFERSFAYGAVVGLALLLTMVVAGANGVAVPLLFRRLGIDPASASGPLVATLNDVIGILVYFGLASAMLRKLVQLV